MALRSFERIHLDPGASQKVHFHLNPRDLGMVTELGSPIIAEGDYSLSVGGGQPGTGSPGGNRQVPRRGYATRCPSSSTPSERKDPVTRTPVLTRREALLLSATAGIAAATPSTLLASDSIKTGVHQEHGTVSTPRSAIAKTQYGPVRGFLAGGVFTFKGVPYGQNAGGENRWLPLKPPTPWKDEYPAFTYGANCPQSLHPWTAIEQTFIQDWDDGWLSEDMLKLNIWTPSLSGSRPVMVYFHGGGFSFGSSYELPSHEGAQMARHHDVVQVSVNHRLNILGFFDASEIGGSAYEDSANVGMTDLVDSLKWVRENIANFGGDPDRVMIYGQSGGGSKVTTLLGMPSASGLIHRAAAQSGGGGNIPTREQQREVARVMMKDLGLAANDIGALQKMDWPSLIAAGNAAITKVNPAGPRVLRSRPSRASPRRLDTLGRRQDHHHAFVLRRRAGHEQERSHPHRLGLGRGQQHDLHPYRDGVACRAGEDLRRGESNRDRHDPQGQLSPQADRHALLHVQRPPRPQRPVHAKQRREDVRPQARPPCRPRLRLLLHLANAAVRRPPRRLAHGRPAVLLRQHQALRAGHRQHT